MITVLGSLKTLAYGSGLNGTSATLVTLSTCQGLNGIVRNDFETPTADGTYKWAIQTDEGIFHEQRGSPGEHGLVVEGQYQYTAPDGQVINVVYRADENGFHAEGAHIPTPLPYNALRRTSTYDDNKLYN